MDRDLPQTLTVEDLGGLLKLCRKTLLARLREGKILRPCYANRKHKLWLASEVSEWLKAGSPSAEQWAKCRRG